MTTPRQRQVMGAPELIKVLAQLDSHKAVLEAEVVELERDLNSLRGLRKKYVDVPWETSLRHCKKTKEQKENLIKEVNFTIELFNLHGKQGRDLVSKLNKHASPIISTNANPANDTVIEVSSSILANSPYREVLVERDRAR